MSRIDENQDVIERLKKIRFTDTNTAMIASVLVDISQSLAILADCALDNWQKNQINRFMSMTDEDKKLYSEYVKKDEAAIINALKNQIPKPEVDDGK